MSLAPLVRILGRGPGRSRNLTRAEAGTAMAAILDGTAHPVATGALLMLMRYRGENAEEIAGFVDAMRARIAPWRALRPDLDWPSYASGRSRSLPLYLLAAKLVAQGGYKVVLHGWNSTQNPAANLRAHLPEAGVASAETPEAARAALDAANIVYVPLEAMDLALMDVLRLRDQLNLRSPVNTALKTFNPSGARAAVQGVFHPPYRALQQDAAALLGDCDVRILKGGGGEFERNPAKAVEIFGLAHGAVLDETVPPLRDETRRLADPEARPGDLARLWRGERDDPFAQTTVTGTAALALMTLGAAATLAEAEALANALWAARRVTLPA